MKFSTFPQSLTETIYTQKNKNFVLVTPAVCPLILSPAYIKADTRHWSDLGPSTKAQNNLQNEEIKEDRGCTGDGRSTDRCEDSEVLSHQKGGQNCQNSR